MRISRGAISSFRDHPTIADLSICGYLFWPDQIGMDLNTYPNIAAWLDRIAALPGYKRPEDLMPSGMRSRHGYRLTRTRNPGDHRNG
jgi:hypothetical protein